MNFKGHLVFGVMASALAGAVATVAHAQHATVGLTVLSTLAMSLYPDLDTPSEPRKFVFGAPAMLALVVGVMIFTGNLIAVAAVVGLAVYPLLCKHRGFTHTAVGSLVTIGIWTYVMTCLHWFRPGEVVYVLGGSFLGYWTHLILDVASTGVKRTFGFLFILFKSRRGSCQNFIRNNS